VVFLNEAITALGNKEIAQAANLFSYRMLLTFQWGMVYSPCKKEAKDASILREVPCQEGNERCQEHYHEEW